MILLHTIPLPDDDELVDEAFLLGAEAGHVAGGGLLEAADVVEDVLAHHDLDGEVVDLLRGGERRVADGLLGGRVLGEVQRALLGGLGALDVDQRLESTRCITCICMI